MSAPRPTSRAKVACGLAALGACAAWGLAPLDSTVEVADPAPSAAAKPQVTIAAAAFDASAFSRPVWPAPPTPPAPPPPPPPPPAAPALTVQLIAITGDGDARRAIVYDPASDAMRTVAVGDTVDHRTVTRIAADAVDLTLPAPHNTTATLSLQPAEPRREAPR